MQQQKQTLTQSIALKIKLWYEYKAKIIYDKK